MTEPTTLAEAAEEHTAGIHRGIDTALACCFLAGADAAKAQAQAQVEALTKERDDLVEALEDEGHGEFCPGSDPPYRRDECPGCKALATGGT